MSKGQGKKIEMKQTGKSRVTEASDGSISIFVPIKIQRRVTVRISSPDGTDLTDDQPLTEFQKALASGHRWLRMLDSGEYRSLQEIAKKEGVSDGHVSRMIGFTMLAPDIVEAILDDTLLPELKMLDMKVNLPRLWEEQREKLL